MKVLNPKIILPIKININKNAFIVFFAIGFFIKKP